MYSQWDQINHDEVTLKNMSCWKPNYLNKLYLYLYYEEISNSKLNVCSIITVKWLHLII